MERKTLVTRSPLPPFEEYVKEVRDIFESRWLTNIGIKHEVLIEELRRFFDIPEVTLLQSGHLTLESVLQALGLRGEVVATLSTFVSATWTIVRVGFTPVSCDTNPETYTLDPAKLETLIIPRTATILLVHVCGTLCDTDALAEVTARHHLPLIYSAAHTFGAKKDGKSVASSDDVVTFSFHATKASHTVEDDAVCYHDPELGQKLFWLKNFDTQENETYCIGGNGETSESEAAMGFYNLRHFPEEVTKRKQVYKRYRERLTGVAGLKLLPQQTNIAPSYAYFLVVFLDTHGETRDKAAERLQARGHFPREYFYSYANAFPFLGQRYAPKSTPIAAIVSRCVLTLPLCAGLECANMGEICRVLRCEI